MRQKNYMKTKVLALVGLIIGFGSYAQDSTSFFSEPEDGGVILQRYIDVPVGNSDLQLSGDWTIETMLRMPPGYHSSQMHIVECYGANIMNGGFALRLTNKRIQAYTMGVGIQSDCLGIDTIPANTWTHIAASYNETSGTLSLYVNGTLDNSDSLGVDQFTDEQTMRIGARGDDNNVNQSSLIDEVRIWGITRSSAEIQSTMLSCLSGDETGLLAYYTFENETGVIVTDRTSNGHDGTIINPLVLENYQNGAYTCDPAASTNVLSQTTISAYPNPAKEWLNIDTELTLEKVVIVDLSGAIVQTENANSFSIASLKPGVYFLQATTELGQYQTKFVKD